MFSCSQITIDAFKHIFGIKNFYAGRPKLALYLLNNMTDDEWNFVKSNIL
jgi:hypothetical protein